MTVGVVDTTVIIHPLRKRSNAINWLQAQTQRLSITPITWLEVMVGAPGKRGQAVFKNLLDSFEIVYLTPDDMDWAMEQMQKFRLSHGVDVMDCLIASVCYRLQVPLYTDNVKDFQALLNKKLVIKPY